MRKKRLFPAGAAILLFMIWFAVGNYRDAVQIAEENLRGLALSLTAAIENIIVRDPSLRFLSTFHPRDIAFFTLIDGRGIYRFHSNRDLIGTQAQASDPGEALPIETSSAARITLGTGEKVYEFLTPLHLPEGTFLLRLTLHTYRADRVIRRAKLSMIILFSLMIAGCTLTACLYRFIGREERHRREMSRQENLAKLGELGATLAHEIRNPLAGIKGYAQVIEKNPADLRNGKFAGRMVQEVLQLEKLVDGLLAYVKSDTFAAAPLDLGELLSATMALLRSEAEQLGVTVEVDAPPGLQISGNRDRLGQLLLNLGKNALQAMPDGGHLRIRAGTSGQDALIVVDDSGQGIRGEDMPRIFEPFFTTKARGTGLGLALCKKIVEEHRGTVNIASTVGTGTTVTITFPASRSLS